MLSTVFIIYDFHVNFGPKNRTPDYNVIRKIRDIIPDLKLGTVRKNDILLALPKKEEWHEIACCIDGKLVTGYMSAKYVGK